MKFKKIVIICIVIISSFIVLYLCVLYHPQNLVKSKYFDKNNIIVSDSIQLISDKKLYLKNEQIIISLVNGTQNGYTFDDDYALEIFYRNKWYFVCPDKEYILPLVLYRLEPQNNSNNLSITLSERYKDLRSGKYRLYKEIENIQGNTYALYVEFTLN